MKNIVFACGFLGLLGLLGLHGIGCGGNKCQALADAMEAKYAQCNVDVPNNSGTELACTDMLAEIDECYTPCYENLDCIVLTDAANPDAAKPEKEFSDCLAACK